MSRKTVLFLAAALVVAAADLFTKDRVFAALERPAGGYRVIEVWGETFRLVAHVNPGGMWGVGGGWNPWILRIVRLAAVAVVFVILKQTPARDRLAPLALGGVLGGAIGNLHDSLRYGHVRDFLAFDFDVPVFDPFPTFNVADSAICVGVILLAAQMLLFPPKPAHDGAEDQAAARASSGGGRSA